jgi:hypothetical protein
MLVDTTQVHCFACARSCLVHPEYDLCDEGDEDA